MQLAELKTIVHNRIAAGFGAVEYPAVSALSLTRRPKGIHDSRNSVDCRPLIRHIVGSLHGGRSKSDGFCW